MQGLKTQEASNKQQVKYLYANRFSTFERVKRVNLWRVLVRDFLQQFISRQDTVADIGAGSCEFINTIKAKHKIAVDLNRDIYKFAAPDVEIIRLPVRQIKLSLSKRRVTAVFLSNILEHLDTKEEAFNLLYDIFSLLPQQGKILIMQPDIKRVGNSYWDFFDHKIPLTQSSLVEVLNAVGFKLRLLKSPFLPYSTKIRWIPLSPALLAIYLRVRPLQIIFGKQFFVFAQKP